VPRQTNNSPAHSKVPNSFPPFLSGARTRAARTVQTMDMSRENPEALERDLARKLRQQVAK